MECMRCSGPVVSQRFQDPLDDTGVLRFVGWRCLTCGEVWDPIILHNRIHAGPSGPRRPRGRPHPCAVEVGA
jgi:hypothetical protein